MSLKPIPIPRRLAERPAYGALPIPFLAKIAADGTPRFSQNDPGRLKRAARERLCGQCGQRVGQRVAFIGPEEELHLSIFLEAHMHTDCARFAATTCPYLNDPNYRVRNRALVDTGRPDHVQVAPRAAVMVLFTTAEFEAISLNRVLCWKVGQPLNVQRF